MGKTRSTLEALSDEHARGILLGLGMSPTPALISVLRIGYQRGAQAEVNRQSRPSAPEGPVKSQAQLMVEEIWTKARFSAGERSNHAPKLPGQGSRLLLVEIMTNGPGVGTDLAARIGYTQSNVTAIYLPRMFRYGLVGRTDRPDRGATHGGVMAREWSLTETGRELAKWCEEYEREVS